MALTRFEGGTGSGGAGSKEQRVCSYGGLARLVASHTEPTGKPRVQPRDYRYRSDAEQRDPRKWQMSRKHRE